MYSDSNTECQQREECLKQATLLRLRYLHVFQLPILTVYVPRPSKFKILYALWISAGFPSAACKNVDEKENAIDLPAYAGPNLFPTSHDSPRLAIRLVVPSRRLQGGWEFRVESSFTAPFTTPSCTVGDTITRVPGTHIRSEMESALRVDKAQGPEWKGGVDSLPAGEVRAGGEEWLEELERAVGEVILIAKDRVRKLGLF